MTALTVAEPSILVFGATGSLGRHALDGLLERGTPAAAVTAAGRNPARLAELASAGFATAYVDLSDSAGVAEVVARHPEVVLISGQDADRLAQHTSVIRAAKDAGVQHLYYTSGVRADDERFAINADHRATEQALLASGLTYTILRNTWYIENYIQALVGPRRTGVFAAAVGDAGVAAASRRDLGEALAVVVATGGHDNATYSLSGDTNFVYSDIAGAMSVVLGREVSYTPVTSDQLRAMLTLSGLDEELVEFLVGLDETIAAGVFSRVGNDLSRLIGRPTSSLISGLTAT